VSRSDKPLFVPHQVEPSTIQAGPEPAVVEGAAAQAPEPAANQGKRHEYRMRGPLGLLPYLPYLPYLI
jgi:hypothetical protein